MNITETKTALDNRILALLRTKNKLWPEREITEGIGQPPWQPVSICALERLQAAGKVKLTLDDNHTYLCQNHMKSYLTPERKAMVAAVMSEYKYPNSKWNGPDYQAAEWEFHQIYPDMPEDEVHSLFNDVCEELGLEF